MTSATDELRRLLDERGAEWEDHSGSIEQRTVYMTPNGWCYVSTANDKWLSYVEYHDMTPAQAVDATLGRMDKVYAVGGIIAQAECRDVCNSASEFTCSACGFNCDLTSWISLFDGDDGRHRHHHHGTPNYCPNCGRRVVE